MTTTTARAHTTEPTEPTGSTGPTRTHDHDAPEPSQDDTRRVALAERIVAATTAALELFSVQLGRELGLYPFLVSTGLTHAELAEQAGIAPRYAREWAEQQAVAGFLDVTSPGDQEERRYQLPAAHVPVLVTEEDPTHVAPLAGLVAGIGGVLRDLPHAYRVGGGVPYSEYGAAFRQGQAGINRPAFGDLRSWVETMPDLVARLDCDPIGRIADIGCGEGWSTIALARAFPGTSVDGFDSDAASVDAARRHAAHAGVADRVTFHLADAGDESVIAGPYDLVLVFEALHDFARPDDALMALRAALADDGVVLVADERVAESFTAPGDEIERLMYGWSVTHCLPASLADVPSAGLGTVLRSETVHSLAAQAGFSASAELPIDNDFFRFYRLDR